MPVHIDEIKADVTMYDGALPLSSEQMSRIVEHVVCCLDERRRDEQRSQAVTRIRPSSLPEPITDRAGDRA